MSCCNWDSENNFCLVKKTTINFEDLAFCMQNCKNYAPSKASESETAICMDCNTEFELKRSRIVEIKDREYGKCPKCGSVNIRVDDEWLNRRTNC